MSVLSALKRHGHFAFSLCGLLLCAGCAWIPPGEEPAEFLEPDSMEETLSHATHHEPEDPIPQWPEDRWWQEFGSPELDSLIDAGSQG